MMKFKEIEIFSYRSVVNQLIPLNESCIGLVGLNESGKTNILSAIRLLDPAFTPTIKDRSKLNNTLPKVRFGFDVGPEINNEVIQYCKNTFAENATIAYPAIATKLVVRRYHAYRQLEWANDSYKKVTRYSCEFSVSTEGFLKPKERDLASIPADLTVTVNEKVFPLSELQIVAKTDLPDSVSAFYEPAGEEFIKKLFGNPIFQFFEKKLPQVVYWQYDQKYLLPSELSYTAFVAENDPYENCAPLFNVMLLSQRLGINDAYDLIAKISEWESDASLRRRDANILTDDLNIYIKKIWPDFDQRIHVELEETKITVHINDPKSQVGNFYEMESRSQGFKTFISFMLTIAAEIDTDQIKNSILLLDEPETHLHPSGARFMREELLKLSTANSVFFATHSIFMIDRANIRRHLIVKKESEATKVTFVDRNNFIQESVIYEALGTTVDEFSIRSKNIIFEGGMDLVLFEFIVTQCLSKRANAFLEYELHDAGGTKNIVNFFKTKTIPKDSDWIVVLDNDLPGRAVPTEIAKSTLDTKNIHYVFYSTEEGKELEDVLPEVLVKDAVSRTESKLEYSPTVGFVLDPKKVVSKNVNEYKYRNGLDSNPLFEATFKECLTLLIKESVEGIREQTIVKKLAAFREKFPVYVAAVQPIFESKGIKFDDEPQI
jgi:predicted ATP-dependent endonuclease of OLD family